MQVKKTDEEEDMRKEPVITNTSNGSTLQSNPKKSNEEDNFHISSKSEKEKISSPEKSVEMVVVGTPPKTQYSTISGMI
jgi:hypothetical protein